MDEVAVARGWHARLELEYIRRGGKTRLARKRQHGPLSVQRPFYPEGNTCHNYILHPPGGVVSGDTLQISINAHCDTHSLLTTPGATKFYRSDSTLYACQEQRIALEEGAIVEWLPQQNIFFNGANASLRTAIDITPGAKFIGWEMHCLGRPAAKELFTRGDFISRTRVSVGGELRLIEQFCTRGDGAIRTATGLRGFAMHGNLIAAPCDEQHRSILEHILLSELANIYPHPVGLTLVDQVLVVRALGEQIEPMQEVFSTLWMALRRNWLHKAPCQPRIWAT